MDTDSGFVFAIVVTGMLLAAGLPYLLLEAKWRWRWREVEDGREQVHAGGGGLYRIAGTVPTYRRQAPGLIRWAAFSCLLFGQMFIPGLLMGAFGLIAGGLGLVSIPGLITAAKLYSAGLALLRREPRLAWFRARNAAAWALWLNGIIFGLSVVAALLIGRSSLPFLAFVNGYGALSVAQAMLVLKATRRNEDALFLPTAAQRALLDTLPARDAEWRAAVSAP